MTKPGANTLRSVGQSLLDSAYRSRRRLATASAMLVALLVGSYAVAGDNGLTVYKQKRIEDKRLAAQVEQLKQENMRLQAHVERLKSDPDAIEHEAREKLHYTRPGEVIYTIRDAPAANRGPASGPATSVPSAQVPQ